MEFSEAWLREYCNPPIDSKALAELLTMSGLEVEERRPAAPPFSGVVVARILSAEQHPSADRLRVCMVDAGKFSPNGPLQIVCGAPNARAGILVPLALVGAVLPPGPDGKPFEIKVGKLRGVESHGMLCSPDELGLGGAHEGLMELPEDTPVGEDIRGCLTLDDQVFNIKLTPNLAHNLGIYGIAREVAALTGSPLKQPHFQPIPASHGEILPVEIQAADLCGRFTGRLIKGVNTKAKTPRWITERLERSGQRSVNVIVDISNYVMFEFSRPNHIFDADKIHDGIVVRWAEDGEELELLSGQTVKLDRKVGVVADRKGVESLAGIMGGNRTGVGDDTVNLYVEVAYWHPEAVAGRSRRFNFSTEAGYRFERGVDPQGTVEHIEYITKLIIDICGGQAGPVDDQIVNLPKRQPVAVRTDRASRILGMPLTQEQCSSVMRRLGLAFTEEPGRLLVTPPSWRFDINVEEDLIEEIIRVLGYNTLPAIPPIAPVQAAVQSENRRKGHTLRRAVADLGYNETINFSFVEERSELELAGNDNPIRLLNPIAAPLAVMRSSLIGSLMSALSYNLARKASRVRLFELGRVFLRDTSVKASLKTLEGIAQPLRLAGLAYGPAEESQWASPDRLVDFFDIKGDVEALLAPFKAEFEPCQHPALHPGRSAAILVEGRKVGIVGELHPRWRQAYNLPLAPMLFELDAEILMRRPFPAFSVVSKYQAVQRDIALAVDAAVSARRIQKAIESSDASGILRSVTLFDVYKPGSAQADLAAGERSLAFRLELQSDQVALSEEAIATVCQAAVKAVKPLGARLRT